jgi:asparagine synthase (glutamine-hydrolysing)
LLPQLLLAGNLRRAWREAGRWRTFVGRGVLPLLPTPLWLAVQRARHWRDPGVKIKSPWLTYSAIRPEFAREQRVEDRAHAKGHNWYYRLPVNTRLARYKALTQLPNGAADYATGFRAWFGVEKRDPTGDLRLFEFCLSLPEGQYQRAGQSRWLLRRALAERLPAEILANKLRGLQAADWFERLSQARPIIVAELARLEQSGLARHALDLARMRNLVERMTQPSEDANRVTTDYRMVLESGLMMGRFLRWLETGA